MKRLEMYGDVYALLIAVIPLHYVAARSVGDRNADESAKGWGATCGCAFHFLKHSKAMIGQSARMFGQGRFERATRHKRLEAWLEEGGDMVITCDYRWLQWDQLLVILCQTVLLNELRPAFLDGIKRDQWGLHSFCQASVLVNEVVAVRNSAKASWKAVRATECCNHVRTQWLALVEAAFENLFGFLAMKPMRREPWSAICLISTETLAFQVWPRTSDFCMLWDNFFVPEDLMVNKGKDQNSLSVLVGLHSHLISNKSKFTRLTGHSWLTAVYCNMIQNLLFIVI